MGGRGAARERIGECKRPREKAKARERRGKKHAQGAGSVTVYLLSLSDGFKRKYARTTRQREGEEGGEGRGDGAFGDDCRRARGETIEMQREGSTRVRTVGKTKMGMDWDWDWGGEG
jgi:hypothetical protein